MVGNEITDCRGPELTVITFRISARIIPFNGMRMKVAKIRAKVLLPLYELGKQVKKSHNCFSLLFVSVGAIFEPF